MRKGRLSLLLPLPRQVNQAFHPTRVLVGRLRDFPYHRSGGMNSTMSRSLNPEQRARVDALFDELLDLPCDQRRKVMAGWRLEEPAVIEEVASLLQAAEGSEEFLSQPVQAAFVAASEPVAEDPMLGSRIGSWRVVRMVGRGGMGVVYEAERTTGDFEQRVAIKLLQPGSAGPSQRFDIERRILARLEHPGIARLLDGGVTDDGRPFMVMEFVDGVPITAFCAARGSSLAERLELFLQVCAAVAYAHRNLVVHRDLKPANVLVTAEGRVKLLDFGIAKLVDAPMAGVTQAAFVLLTPSCAAPEQLSGQPVTTLTDVYALGLMLFQLLTGWHPWISNDSPSLPELRAAQQHRVPLPSEVARRLASAAPVGSRGLCGDLDAIVGCALRPDPADRYPSVETLAADVQRHARGEPVVARAGARLYVVGRVLRRHRWAVAASAAVVLALAIGLALAAWQAQRASLERDIARRAAAREEAVRYDLTALFRNAIADSGSTQPTTAKSMIDASAQQVLREYRDKPQLGGELVLALADLYAALEDVAGADALLEPFVAEAEHTARADPRVLADARQKLANIELLRGHTDRAATLLAPAESFWRRFPAAYAEERLEGLTIRARLLRAMGNVDGAIALFQEAIRQRVALSGHNHRETGLLFNSLAIALTSANRLPEALAAYRETSEIYQAIGRGDSIDAQIIQANTGTLELRLGHLESAQTLLDGAISRERALAGDSAAVAAGLGQYGRLLSIRGHNEVAIPTLREAVELAARYTTPNGPMTLRNRLFLGQAQLENGDRDAARITLTAARDAASAQAGLAALPRLRARLLLARVAAASAQRDEARTELDAVCADLRALGEPAQLDLAQALLARGETDLDAAEQRRAVRPLREAVALEESSQGPQWQLAVVQERLGESLAAERPTEAIALLREAERVLNQLLGSRHSETLRARRALARTNG
jgi:eukaryotic-like serine/threonine-protein kinase